MLTTLTGILLHAVGAASSASSIVPGKFIRRWEWDVYWLGFAAVAFLLLPLIVAGLTVPEVQHILMSADKKTVALTLGLGFVYGFGGYGFGLSCRMIGFSLTYAISIGFSATMGTIIPPLVIGGEALDSLLHTSLGIYVFSALGIAIIGMYLVGNAGYGREKHAISQGETGEMATSGVLIKGVLIALAAGFLSACYSFALHVGAPLGERAVEFGAQPLLKINVVFILTNGGAFLSNLFITIYLIRKHKAFGQYLDTKNPSLLRNYSLAILGGAAWYFQFFFYGIAENFMGDFKVASWALHMVMLIIFAQVWGIYFREWNSSPTKIKSKLYLGLTVLVISVLIVSWGNIATSK